MRICKRCLIRDLDSQAEYNNMFEYINGLDEQIKTNHQVYEVRLRSCQNCDSLVNGMSYDEIYSVFEVNGFRFGLFAFEKVKEKHVFGDNCLPSIDVESLDILKEKNKGIKNSLSTKSNRLQLGM